jgi:hypothetical protein
MNLILSQIEKHSSFAPPVEKPVITIVDTGGLSLLFIATSVEMHCQVIDQQLTSLI